MISLAIIAESEEPVPVAEIARKLGLPRSSASRLMASLRDGGLIEQNSETRRYTAGSLAWRLGMKHHSVGYDSDMIFDCLLHITTVTGFTAWMAAMTGTDVVLLRQSQGVTPTQFSVRLGQTLPAHATAIGKAMLSRLPDRTINALYDENLPSVTAETITKRSTLLTELYQIRREKVAISNQEAFNGVISVGSAVFGAISNSPLGVSVSFPVSAGRPEEVAELLRRELARIGRECGDRLWN